MEALEITLTRKIFTETTTISDLSIDGIFECFVLEDKDRGLTFMMDKANIEKLKVHGKTAIPYGRYQIVVTKSNRFSMLRGHDVYLPILLKVPGYEGIRIHTGNKPEDTEGCLLPAKKHTNTTVSESTIAFTQLNEKINNALKSGKQVWITIKKLA